MLLNKTTHVKRTKMKILHIIILFAILGYITLLSCNKKSPVMKENNQASDTTAKLFLPGTIATGMNERDAALSPDGSTFFYTVQYQRGMSMIVQTSRENGKWSKPKVAAFSKKYNNLEPVFHPDGERLFFVSNRPLQKNGETKDYDIWYVTKTANGWSDPVNPGSPLNSKANEFYPSFTKDGTVYFCAIKEESMGGEDLYYSKVRNGKFQAPENMGTPINSEANEYNAFISPDGTFIMYNTHIPGKGIGSGDIYIAFKNEEGKWKKPVNMGPKINSPYFEYCPSLTADGKYLFLTSQKMHDSIVKTPYNYELMRQKFNGPGNGNGDIYWISSQVIYDLRSKSELE
jgi:Tol biopolymer transport system component